MFTKCLHKSDRINSNWVDSKFHLHRRLDFFVWLWLFNSFGFLLYFLDLILISNQFEAKTLLINDFELTVTEL